MLAEIVHQVTGMTLREFLREEVFGPLGMDDTSLGCRARAAANASPRALAARADGHRLELEQPVLARLRRAVGRPDHVADRLRPLLPDDARRRRARRRPHPQPGDGPRHDDATSSTTCRRCRRKSAAAGRGAWAGGCNWPGHSANFGDLLGPRTYGHWGATGTLCWIDPETRGVLILFTTQPQEPEGRFLARVSNVVAAALA